MNEEDIKNLSEIIELCKEELDNNNENVTAILDLTDLKSLRNVINRNKELEEKVKHLHWKNGVYIDTIFEGGYIKISKIKEKIEELNKLITEAQKELGSASKEYTIYVYQKDILEELLEKRK